MPTCLLLASDGHGCLRAEERAETLQTGETASRNILGPRWLFDTPAAQYDAVWHTRIDRVAPNEHMAL